VTRRAGALALLAVGLAAAAVPAPATPESRVPRVFSLEVADAIQPVTAQYVAESLQRARREEADLVILRLDTPGGLLNSTETIVRAILDSRAPVAVFGSGTQAASAGFFITIAADVAVMAPGTRFGAAHPVSLFGGSEDRGKGIDVMLEKAENDAAAWIRTLAENRGRNVTLAEEAVRKSRAFTEKEALEARLIEYICSSEEEILRVLDGKTIRRFSGEKTTLRLAGAERVSLPMSTREKFLSWLAHPSVLFFLLLAGAVGVYVEFTHPGLIFPGVVGAICLLLFAYGTQILPINYAGLLLILLGIGLFILEIKVTSYGLLTMGGVICLVLGSLMLFRKPGMEGLGVPLWTVASLSTAAALIMAFLTHRVVWAHRQRVTTGEEGMVGETGVALTDLSPEGSVFVHGETWNARAREALPRGTRVKVVAVRGMILDVEPLRDAPGSAG
jgi:membrane-bound serine protease (ClpP class)